MARSAFLGGILFRALVGAMFFLLYMVILLVAVVTIAFSPLQIAGVDLFGTALTWVGGLLTLVLNSLAVGWRADGRTLRNMGKIALLALGPAMLLFSAYLEHSVRWAHLLLAGTTFPDGFDARYLNLGELLVWAATR